MTTPEQIKGEISAKVDEGYAAVRAPLEQAIADQQATIVADKTRIGVLEAEVAKLRAELDALNPAPGMFIGAANNMPSGLPKDNTLANFQALDAQIGPLTLRRSFPGLTNIQAVCQTDLDVGYKPVVSLKRGPVDEQWKVVGRQLGTVARATGQNIYMIPNHEHQKDFGRAAEFVAWYRHVADILLTESAGGIDVGDASLGYAYRHAGGMVGKAGNNQGPLEPAEAWLVGDDLATFHALDVYSQQGVPLAEYPNFVNWLQSLSGSTLPLIVAEYGTLVVPHGTTATAEQDATRAKLYATDLAYLESLGFRATLLWNGGGDNGWWAPDGPKAKAAFKAVAARGRTA